MKKQRTSKDFYQHSDTGEIYAVERLWSGGIVTSAGPSASAKAAQQMRRWGLISPIFFTP